MKTRFVDLLIVALICSTAERIARILSGKEEKIRIFVIDGGKKPEETKKETSGS